MSTIPTLHQRFQQAVWWNTLEAVPYQLILSAHNMLLFGIIGAHEYGLVGTIFSLIFLAVGVAGLGFEAALPTFFADAQASKAQYKKIIGLHYAPTVCILSVAAVGVPLLLGSMKVTVPPGLMLIVASLILVEGLKKALRVLLHAAFYNRHTAGVELFQIVTYVALVWISYGLGLPLTAQLLFGMLLAISAVCLIMLAYYLSRVYHHLPTDNQPSPTIKANLTGAIAQRCYTTVTTMSHQFFSGNALVPLFAYKFGLSSAGTLKLICTVAYGATICIQKIFGSTSDALFANIKYAQLHDKQQAFFLVTKHLYAALYGVLLFGMLAVSWFFMTNSTALSDASFICALLFFVIHLSEQFFSTYERFFIVENRAGELMLFNGLTIICLYTILHGMPTETPYGMLQAVLCVRIISFILLSGVAFAWWRIRPQMQINPLYLIGSLAVSFICFLVAR